MWHLCYPYDFRGDVSFLEHTVTFPRHHLHGKNTNNQKVAMADVNAVLKYKRMKEYM